MRIMAFALVLAAAAGSSGAATRMETPMRETADAGFSSAREAEAYLAQALPEAVRANPKYRTRSDGSLSEWTTKSVSFAPASSGAVEVTMDETYTQWKGEAATPGTHKAAFSLADVTISDFTEPGDATPSGEPARGLLFACAKPGCIAAEWGGQASRADKTDVYIQDEAARARILAAFLFLKGAKAPA